MDMLLVKSAKVDCFGVLKTTVYQKLKAYPQCCTSYWPCRFCSHSLHLKTFIFLLLTPMKTGVGDVLAARV